MSNNEIVDKWKTFFKDDNKTIKKLSKLKNLNDENSFFTKLFFDNKKIIARIGIGYGLLNKLTIKSIANAFAEVLIRNQKIDKKIDILVSSDGSIEVLEFLKDIADVLEFKKISTTAFKGYSGYDQKFICRTIKKLELDGGIFIEKSIFNDQVFNIFFINHDGFSFEYNIIKEIELELEKHNLFEIASKKAKTEILSNNKLISDYVAKLLSLTSRKLDQRKIKICISNYNNSTTSILKKILGNMDFNYVINDNINKKNIHKKKKINSKTYHKFYWKDLRFAKKNKCNILVCYSKNGSELILFVFDGNNFYYLDSNEISLMFLNFFLTNINLSSKNINNSYISTDIQPIQSIKKIINKYNLELLITEKVETVTNKNLLFYWNQESQFIFGENKIIEFSFHHLIIRFLEMMNYYETQRLNIKSQKNILNKMYGNYKTHTLIFDFDLYKLNFWLDNINESNTNLKFPIDFVTRYKYDNILNQNLIAKISLKDGVELFFKFNYINRKIIIYIRLKVKNYNFFNINKNSFISKIYSTIKSDFKNFI